MAAPSGTLRVNDELGKAQQVFACFSLRKGKKVNERWRSGACPPGPEARPRCPWPWSGQLALLIRLLEAAILPLAFRVRLTRERVCVEKAVKETCLCSF